jgi:site-specific DNA-methyltransferase (adenine-specific)
METLKIEYVDISLLKPNEYNPKRMNEKEFNNLKQSITEFGIVDPLIINSAEGRKGIIIGGHQRYQVYAKLGITQIPCIFVNIPDIQKEQELCIRLTKNTGRWDLDILANIDSSLLELSGFSGKELEMLFDNPPEFSEAPEPQKKTIVKCPACGHEFEDKKL